MPTLEQNNQNLSPQQKKYPWVFQTRRIKGKSCRVQIKRAWPTNPRTKAQQLNRQKFAVATLCWQLLDEISKAKWRSGSFYGFYWGYRNFIRDFMLAKQFSQIPTKIRSRPQAGTGQKFLIIRNFFSNFFKIFGKFLTGEYQKAKKFQKNFENFSEKSKKIFSKK